MKNVKIGLEIHGYLRMSQTHKKLFCNCSIAQHAEPNTNVCPVCTAQPGSKPMLPNEEAVEKIIKCGLMLGCTIIKKLMFQRKHYNWPDLPGGYQKTMSGSYCFPVGTDGEFLGIGIEQVHLEEDPARWDPATGLVDYNRCGFPLIEIVTKPDFASEDQVRDWIKKVLRTLSYIDAIDAESGIKSDVNVSIAPDFVRAEIKNVNSLKSIGAAIIYEINRQQQEPMKEQETRQWNDELQKTFFMRKKEGAADYRFIPEPDLPAITLSDEQLMRIQSTLPEKPEQKIETFKKMGVSAENAVIFASDLGIAEWFEQVTKEVDPKVAERWFRGELLRVLNFHEKSVADIPSSVEQLIELLLLIQHKTITDPTGKKLMDMLCEKSFSPKEYVEKEGLGKVSDTNQLEQFCKEAIDENPKAVKDYQAGEENSLNFLVGQVMRKSQGKADPGTIKEMMKSLIK